MKLKAYNAFCKSLPHTTHVVQWGDADVWKVGGKVFVIGREEDGEMVCSCLVLAAEAEGRRVDTIEGVSEGSELHPIQQKFLENAALQCGFCTPGFIVASKALLEKNPNPTETEVRYWLAGNLCRCTGYDKIVRAVMDAAAELRQERTAA